MSIWRKAVVIPLVLLGCKGGARVKEDAAAAMAASDAFQAKLSKVRDLVRSGAAGKAAAKDCALAAPLRLATTTPSALDELVDKGKTTMNAADKLRFFTSSSVGALTLGPAAAGGGSASQVKDMQARTGMFLGVVTVEEDVRPKHGEGATITDGTFRANVVVYDYDHGTALCRITFTARTSDDMKNKVAGYSAKSIPDSILDDYVDQIKQEGNAAIGHASAGKLAFDW